MAFLKEYDLIILSSFDLSVSIYGLFSVYISKGVDLDPNILGFKEEPK